MAKADHLTKEKEIQWIKAVQERGCKNSLDCLINASRGFIHTFLKPYRRRPDLPNNDLFQEGVIGLIRAVHKYDASHGARLLTFAARDIGSAVHEYALRNTGIVRMARSKAELKLYYNLRPHLNPDRALTQVEVERIASDFGVKERDVRRIEIRMRYSDTPFVMSEGEDSEYPEMAEEKMPSSDLGPAEIVERDDFARRQSEVLKSALEALPERNRIIIEQRWTQDKKRTLGSLSKEFNVSAERVRQLEASTIAMLKKEMTLAQLH